MFYISNDNYGFINVFKNKIFGHEKWVVTIVYLYLNNNHDRVLNTNVMWFLERWSSSGSCKLCINEAIASGDFTSMNRPPSHIHRRSTVEIG